MKPEIDACTGGGSGSGGGGYGMLLLVFSSVAMLRNAVRYILCSTYLSLWVLLGSCFFSTFDFHCCCSCCTQRMCVVCSFDLYEHNAETEGINTTPFFLQR